jgi:putative SOS response-associated peptidase YedK
VYIDGLDALAVDHDLAPPSRTRHRAGIPETASDKGEPGQGPGDQFPRNRHFRPPRATSIPAARARSTIIAESRIFVNGGCYTPRMCGRFYLTASPAEIRKQFKLEKMPELVPRYNIAPMQTSPIVIAEDNVRVLHVARWGLVPSWSRDLSPGAGMINAPAETLEEKPAYRKAFGSQRCLVPANGFYEWQARGTKKQPYKIALRNGVLIAFAGLWERWTPEGGDPVETFTIVTTRASKLVSEVHDRMPVIIAPADYQRWLTAPTAAAKRLLVPFAAGLTIAAVGERVNNIKNDDVSLLQPAVL